MEIVTHKFKRKDNDIVYLINLVDVTGRPLESTIAETIEDKLKISSVLAKKHNIKSVFHNSGFSIVNKCQKNY
jgi:predicted transcriptional regulator YheO